MLLAPAGIVTAFFVLYVLYVSLAGIVLLLGSIISYSSQLTGTARTYSFSSILIYSALLSFCFFFAPVFAIEFAHFGKAVHPGGVAVPVIVAAILVAIVTFSGLEKALSNFTYFLFVFVAPVILLLVLPVLIPFNADTYIPMFGAALIVVAISAWYWGFSKGMFRGSMIVILLYAGNVLYSFVVHPDVFAGLQKDISYIHRVNFQTSATLTNAENNDFIPIPSTALIYSSLIFGAIFVAGTIFITRIFSRLFSRFNLRYTLSYAISASVLLSGLIAYYSWYPALSAFTPELRYLNNPNDFIANLGTEKCDIWHRDPAKCVDSDTSYLEAERRLHDIQESKIYLTYLWVPFLFYYLLAAARAADLVDKQQPMRGTKSRR